MFQEYEENNGCFAVIFLIAILFNIPSHFGQQSDMSGLLHDTLWQPVHVTAPVTHWHLLHPSAVVQLSPSLYVLPLLVSKQPTVRTYGLVILSLRKTKTGEQLLAQLQFLSATANAMSSHLTAAAATACIPNKCPQPCPRSLKHC